MQPGRIATLICGAAVLAAACGPSWKPAPPREDPPPPPELTEPDVIDRSRAVAAIFEPRVADGTLMGVSVAVLENGHTTFFGYGARSAEDRARPDADTVFEIASFTKVFTALMLARQVERGKLTLDTRVSDLLPKTVSLAVVDGVPITLEHLATHQSGLPRLPSNLDIADPRDPYATYTVDKLYQFLDRVAPARAPGLAYEYSNLGFGLLGHLLALQAGKAYEELLGELVLTPLGMTSSGVALTDDMRDHLAPGHTADGTPTPGWVFGPLAGAGGVHSSARDMAKLIAAFLRPRASGMQGALTTMTEPRAKLPQGGMLIGLAWHLVPVDDGFIAWHNGQTGGYHSFAAFDRNRDLGVVVLANTATAAVDAAAMKLIRDLREPPKKE